MFKFVIESAHVKVDEFAENTEKESKKEPENYRRFVYIEPDTLPKISVNQETASIQPSTIIESQEDMQTESQEDMQTESQEDMQTESQEDMQTDSQEEV